MSSDLEFLEASAKLVQDCIAEVNRMLAEVRDADIRGQLENSLGELTASATRIESERRREIGFLAAVEKRRQIREKREKTPTVVETPVAVPAETPVEGNFAAKTRDLLLAEYRPEQTQTAIAASNLNFEDWTQSRELLQQSLNMSGSRTRQSGRNDSTRAMDSWLQSSGAASDPAKLAEREQREWERLLGDR